MAPVKTAVILPSGNRVDLIIPISSGSTLTVLQDLAIERAARYDLADISQVTDILLRFESQSGPFLNPDDKVEDVISVGETVFVMLQDSSTSASSRRLQSGSSTTSVRSANDFQLRIITPHLAHCHEDIRTIPLLGGGKVFSASSTLRDLRAAIADSLDVSLGPEEQQPQECNCKMAEIGSGMPQISVEGSSKVLVISGFSNIVWVDVLEPTYSSIIAGLRHLLGETFEDVKTVHLKGGDQTDDDLFTRLPVVSVCAKSRHSKMYQTATASPMNTSILDLHTAEGPIQTSCLGFSVEKLGLTDLVVNGVLSIYAVERRADSTASKRQALGKDAMFSTADHWDLPRMTSSARGSNAFLSSLRVFTDKINAKNMDAGRQNTVLQIIHELTRYLPAVRAVRILMDGKTLQSNECAAIVQNFAEALRDLVPRNLIENDERRYLEGTRLLFGVVLQKVEALSKKSTAPPQNRTEDTVPYLNLLKTADLRDVRTGESIFDAVQTNFGLMEKGSFDAFQPGGILSHRGAEDTDLLSASPDPQALRVALLNGGAAPELNYYDTDALQASLSSTTVSDDLLKQVRDFSRDLPYLGMLCESIGLSVIHPTALKSATPPILTLDRDGYLCVYVGRPACAAPDRDISIFVPANGTEEAIDVNIVAQLIEPIIRAREQDGTTVFDLFSKGLRSKDTKPTELLMFCVDCSGSMDDSSDFQEIHETPTVPTLRDATLDDQPVIEYVDDPISLDDTRAWLSEHESFEDIVSIVALADSSANRTVAEEVIEFISRLTSRELMDKGKRVTTMRSWATRGLFLEAGTSLELQMISLRRLLVGLNIYKTALCDTLIFKAQSWNKAEDFTWSYGRPIPHAEPASSSSQILDVIDSLFIPPEIICPISQAVFEDPVTTSDNFTYDRRSIERWFQSNRSSPLTGLPLRDLSLRRHQPLYYQTKRWLSGEDILEAAPPPRKRPRVANLRSAADLNLNFVTPAGTFSRKVPSTLSLADLYKLAYRGMRGVQRSFSLHLQGSLLKSSDQQLASHKITSGSEIVANIHTALEHTSMTPENRSERMCLIKVYKSSSEIFSYWIPQDTSHTVASIIFRYWRFQLSSSGALSSKDQFVWSGLKYAGDRKRTGLRHNHWDLLAASLNNLNPRKLVDDEELCSDPSMQKSDETEGQNSSSNKSDATEASIVSTTPVTCYRILKVKLSPYKSPETIEFERKEKLRHLTRLAVSKQVFGAFINRLIAYNYPTAIGLVSIGTSASLVQPLSTIVENFRHAIDKLEASGDTSLWEALALAADQLAHFGQKYPGMPKRIICLSDGVDTKSVVAAHHVCRRLLRDKIVVDSCSIGMEDNADLRTLSFLTGGYKFVPKTLEQAVAICELEPVLSIHERPPVPQPVIAPLLTQFSFTLAKYRSIPDESTRDNFPARKLHPNLGDQFVRINSFERNNRNTTTPLVHVTSANKSAFRQRRLLTEIQCIAANPHPSYDVYVSESNMGFWKVVLSGPAESAYASSTFVLYLEMCDDYPQSPPKGRFITRIFHPNINSGGLICHSIFSRNYTVDITNKQVLDTVFGLLLVPEFTDPINTVVTLNFYWDEVAFREEVKKHIEKYALKGREEWGKEILGERDPGQSRGRGGDFGGVKIEVSLTPDEEKGIFGL